MKIYQLWIVLKVNNLKFSVYLLDTTSFFLIFKDLKNYWYENYGLQVSTTDTFDLYVTITRYEKLILFSLELNFVYNVLFIYFLFIVGLALFLDPIF